MIKPISTHGGAKLIVRECARERGKKDHLAELGGGTSVAAAELHWRQLNLVDL